MGLASLRFPSVFMACCIVLGLLPSVSPLFLWPAVLFWACLPPFPLCFNGLLYCRVVCSVQFFPSGFFPSGSGFPKHGNFIVFPIESCFQPFSKKVEHLIKKGCQNEAKIDAKIIKNRFGAAKGATHADFDSFWAVF